MATQMAGDCHMGYAGQHAMFVVLYAGLLPWFCNASVKVPGALRCLMITGMVGTAVYHFVTGAVCSSKSANAVMRAHWDTVPLFRIRLIQLAFFFQCYVAPVASHLSHRAGGTARVLKLAVVNGLALAHAGAMCCWWMCESTKALYALALIFLPFAVASSVFIFSATKLLPYLWVLAPGFAVVLNLLSAAFPFDLDGRLKPYTPADELHPHPAVVLYAFIYDTRIAAMHVGICYVVIAAQTHDATPLASPDSGLPRPVGLGWHLLPHLCKSAAMTRQTLRSIVGSEWSLVSAGLIIAYIAVACMAMAYVVVGLLSAGVIIFAVISSNWMLNPWTQEGSIVFPIHLRGKSESGRGLLSAENRFDVPWGAQCTGCVLVALFAVVTHFSRGKRRRDDTRQESLSSPDTFQITQNQWPATGADFSHGSQNYTMVLDRCCTYIPTICPHQKSMHV